MEFLFQPWAWYVAGPAIALVMFLLMWMGARFGVSTTMKTMCAIGGAGKYIPFFNYDWKNPALESGICWRCGHRRFCCRKLPHRPPMRLLIFRRLPLAICKRLALAMIRHLHQRNCLVCTRLQVQKALSFLFWAAF